MKRILPFIQFFLFGNIYISLGTVAITCATLHQFDLDISANKNYLGLIFYSTVFIYNIQRYFYPTPLPNANISTRRKWIKNNQKSILALLILSVVGGFYFFLQQASSQLFILLAPLFVMSILYFSLAQLRKTPLTKLVTLAIVWLITTAVIPLIINKIEILSLKSILHIIERFCFMLAICIPFDIRDLATDKADSTITLPQEIGEKAAINSSLILISLHILIIVILALFKANTMLHSTAIITAGLISLYLISKTNYNRSEYFYVAGIDGTLILQGLIVSLTSYYS